VRNQNVDLLEENNMKKGVASNFAAVGYAAIILLPSTYAAYGRSGETPASSVSQNIDRADARVADLKARLRLTAEQARYWPRFEFAYREIAANRAKSVAGENIASESELQTGRTSSDSSAAPARPISNDESGIEARRQRDANNIATEQDTNNITRERAARNAMRERDADNNKRRDDIYAMQREADALDVRSADLRQISDAAKPLYDSLDDRQRRRFVQFVHDDLQANDVDMFSRWRR
jgi:hypothetical protein